MAARSFIVQGSVQGVGFRAYVARLAERSGISGEVWNRVDGSVEVYAEHGSVEILQSFGDQLRLGPGSIEDVAAAYEIDRGVAGFRIGPSR